MRAALVQLSSSDDPARNLPVLLERLDEAAAAGAEIALTPEVTNCVSASRERQDQVLRLESDDPTLAAVRDWAARRGIWVLLGSLALKTGDSDGRLANRSLLIDPEGAVVARYDKIHMFDVDVSETERYRESAAFRPGREAVTVAALGAVFGLTICYDVRFAYLYRTLAQAGAQVLTVPAAFSPVTGRAHWETLLRARAIETGCFVLAPAQTGHHSAEVGRERSTHGHSMAVAPWGELLLDAGEEPGVHLIDLDLGAVDEARRRVPAIRHDRAYRTVSAGGSS
jgi:predicted amidohydrolase